MSCFHYGFSLSFNRSGHHELSRVNVVLNLMRCMFPSAVLNLPTPQHQEPILFPPEFASIIHDMVGGKSRIIHKDAMEDDPQRRKPDITRANNVLGWQPLVSVATSVAEYCPAAKCM